MTKIYYFSGTGNSLWSAKEIARLIGEAQAYTDKTCELFNIGFASRNNEIVIEADAVVLVFPSYAFGLPLAVRLFVKKAVFKTPYLASFVTYGTTPLGTLGLLQNMLKSKKIDKMYFGKIPAVENYLAMFGTPKDEMIKKRCTMQKEATAEAAKSIIERKENSVSGFRPFSAFVVRLFYLGIKIFFKRYRVSDKCSGCAICEKICPAGAIVMKDEKPKFTSKCEHCQGCINICPLRAIRFGRVKFGTAGYRHPEIEIKELFR